MVKRPVQMRNCAKPADMSENPTRVIIVVEGGAVQEVYTDGPIIAQLIDWNNIYDEVAEGTYDGKPLVPFTADAIESLVDCIGSNPDNFITYPDTSEKNGVNVGMDILEGLKNCEDS